MQLSKRCEYGLRALIDLGLAREMGVPWVRASALAEHERIPVPFLEQILHSLRVKGWLRSRRGATGGYALTDAASRLPVGDLVRWLDGPLGAIGCVRNKERYEPCSCPDEDHCGLRLLMLDVRTAVAGVLDRFTLADVVSVTLRKVRGDGIELPFLGGGVRRTRR